MSFKAIFAKERTGTGYPDEITILKWTFFMDRLMIPFAVYIFSIACVERRREKKIEIELWDWNRDYDGEKIGWTSNKSIYTACLEAN